MRILISELRLPRASEKQRGHQCVYVPGFMLIAPIQHYKSNLDHEGVSVFERSSCLIIACSLESNYIAWLKTAESASQPICVRFVCSQPCSISS